MGPHAHLSNKKKNIITLSHYHNPFHTNGWSGPGAKVQPRYNFQLLKDDIWPNWTQNWETLHWPPEGKAVYPKDKQTHVELTPFWMRPKHSCQDIAPPPEKPQMVLSCRCCHSPRRGCFYSNHKIEPIIRLLHIEIPTEWKWASPTKLQSLGLINYF